MASEKGRKAESERLTLALPLFLSCALYFGPRTKKKNANTMQNMKEFNERNHLSLFGLKRWGRFAEIQARFSWMLNVIIQLKCSSAFLCRSLSNWKEFLVRFVVVRLFSILSRSFCFRFIFLLFTDTKQQHKTTEAQEDSLRL